VFQGAGSWDIDGKHVVVKWDTATGVRGKELSNTWHEEELARYTRLQWNGAKGCSLTWAFPGVLRDGFRMQVLIPVEYALSEENRNLGGAYRGGDKWYGGETENYGHYYYSGDGAYYAKNQGLGGFLETGPGGETPARDLPNDGGCAYDSACAFGATEPSFLKYSEASSAGYAEMIAEMNREDDACREDCD